MSLRKSLDKILRVAKLAQLSAMQTLQAEQKRRIFNRGEATDGSKIGKYKSEAYKKRRQDKPRQIKYKDLQFDGDLSRSMQAVQQGGKAVYGFTTDKQRIIANAQEKQTGKTIFKPSNEEKKEVIDTIIKEIRFQLGR